MREYKRRVWESVDDETREWLRQMGQEFGPMVAKNWTVEDEPV